MTAAVLFRPAADALSLLDQLLTGVAIVDEEGRLVHCNPAFVDATGLSSWRGCPVDLLDGGSGELRTLVARALRRGAPVMRHGFELAARDPPLRVTLALAPYQAAWSCSNCTSRPRPPIRYRTFRAACADSRTR